MTPNGLDAKLQARLVGPVRHCNLKCVEFEDKTISVVRLALRHTRPVDRAREAVLGQAATLSELRKENRDTAADRCARRGSKRAAIKELSVCERAAQKAARPRVTSVSENSGPAQSKLFTSAARLFGATNTPSAEAMTTTSFRPRVMTRTPSP